MPEFLIEPELKLQDLIRVSTRITNDSEYYVAQPSGHRFSNIADMFKAWLLEEAGKSNIAIAENY